MRYCTKCLYPETKPNLTFDADGVCSACTAYAARATIDWSEREAIFNGIAIDRMACRRGNAYDCIIPVSGGKDSTYQVVKVLEHGLRPLAVTAMTDHLTPLGWKNLDNISKLGVDHVMVQVNQQVRRKINKFCLQHVGDISWPEHVLIFTVPVREAILRGIPLIIYGENPENEYGGPLAAQTTTKMDRRWLEEFGGLNGLRVSDFVDAGVATRKDLEQYFYPEDADLRRLGLESLFLGQFFEWNGQDNFTVARKNGFCPHHGVVSGGLFTYENLDNAQTGIHDYFKFIKYGYGRATDHACNEIRRGRLTREAAIGLVRRHDGAFPWGYMDVGLTEVLDSIGMTHNEFNECIHAFVNPELFELDHAYDSPIPKFEVQ